MVEIPIPLRALDMSDELQTGDVPAENNAPPPEDQQAGADLATATDGQQESNAQVDEAAAKQAASQDATQKVINEKHRQAKQAERERDEARAQVAQFEKEKRESEAARVGEIPPIPDEFDENFKERMAERDEAIANKVRHEQNEVVYQQSLENQQAQEVQRQNAVFQQASVSYNARAVELGIDTQELQAAGNQVVGYGLTPQLTMNILADRDGPLITKYLAANPMDALNLSNMSEFQQGAAIEAIRVKAESLKPKASNTPPPPDNLSGNGAEVDTNKYPNSKGATFS